MSHRIRSSVNPTTNLFNPKDLPKELLNDVDIESELMHEAKNVNIYEVFKTWMNHRYPTLISNQDCVDVISDEHDYRNKQARRELYLGGKLALIGYAMPYFIPRVSTHFHMKNSQFHKYLESFVAESTFLAYQNMDQILEGDDSFVLLPNNAQISGFYIRTPIQIWNQEGKRVYKIPSWEHRSKLMKHMVIGNVNVYVLRQNLEDGFECYLCFRGTSNEFNAIPQYGDHMKNTQIYRLPQYDPIENKFYPEGSKTVPLFYHYYADMIDNVWPHIEQCLSWLQVMDHGCKRLVVSGHSMGAALVTTYCYILKSRNPELWDKTEFRAYASPLCCNDAAVLHMEQWIINSMQTNKFIEAVNTDDFVNIQYLLGGRLGLKKSIRKGTAAIASWLATNYLVMYGRKNEGKEGEARDPKENNDSKVKHEQGDSDRDSKVKPDIEKDDKIDAVPRMMRIIQLYPEIAVAAFMHGAIDGQINSIPDDKTVGFRLGQRSEEVKLWGTRELKSTYNKTLRLYFCKRRIQWQNEYLGKSHSNYVDLNINIFWAPLRMYEDHLYRFYVDHNLRHNNRLRIVGMFPAIDEHKVKQMISHYRPPTYEPRILSIQKDLQKFEKKRSKVKPVIKKKTGKKRHQLLK